MLTGCLEVQRTLTEPLVYLVRKFSWDLRAPKARFHTPEEEKLDHHPFVDNHPCTAWPDWFLE